MKRYILRPADRGNNSRGWTDSYVRACHLKEQLQQATGIKWIISNAFKL